MYRTNPQTGERELVIEITRGAGEASARPRWLMVALFVVALVFGYRVVNR